MDYSYTSVFMYETDEYKQKLDKFVLDTNYKYKYKFDWKILVFFLGFVASIIVSIIFSNYLFLVTVGFAALIAFQIEKCINDKRIDFFDKLERYIKAKESDGYLANSAIYETYFKFDDQHKTFSFKYNDKICVNVPYNEIKSYDISLDRFKIDKKKLDERLARGIKSFIITLNLDNNKKIEIGYSNVNKYIKLKKSFGFQQFCNMFSINVIAKSLDKIIYKNDKKK